MSILHIEVVVGSKYIAGDNGGELATVLLSVALVHHINHSFGMTVAKVAIMRRTIVDLENILFLIFVVDLI